jgi:hypothetical protein
MDKVQNLDKVQKASMKIRTGIRWTKSSMQSRRSIKAGARTIF